MPVLLFIVGINFVGVGALIPVLPLTVIESGYPASVMTLLLASYAFAMFIDNPVLGLLSDYFGRRLMLFGSLAVGAAAHAWFAFSGDIVTMFVARIVAGFAAGNTGVIQAMIADSQAKGATSILLERVPPCVPRLRRERLMRKGRIVLMPYSVSK